MAEESKLRKPMDEALATLNQRIAEGEALQRHLPTFLGNDVESDHAATNQIDSWHKGNLKVLERLFTTPGEKMAYAIAFSPEKDQGWYVGEIHNAMRLRLQNLQSLRDNLHHYDVVEGTPGPRQRFALLDTLHETIRKRCRALYEDGHYANAILDAFKAVEDEIRTKIGASPEEVGKELISRAMKKTAPLIVLSDIEPEQESAHLLYMGAIGFFKNPHSHRFPEVNDPVKALEIISVASTLMRMLDEATVRNPEDYPANPEKARKPTMQGKNESAQAGIMPVMARVMSDHSPQTVLLHESLADRGRRQRDAMRKAERSARVAMLYERGRQLHAHVYKRAEASESTEEERQWVTAWRDHVTEAVSRALSSSKAVWVLSAQFQGHPHGHSGEITLRPHYLALYLEACLQRLNDVLRET